MVNACVSLLYILDVLLFKDVNASVDLMSVGREFHSNADVEANVFPPSVALLLLVLLGHRIVM